MHKHLNRGMGSAYLKPVIYTLWLAPYWVAE